MAAVSPPRPNVARSSPGAPIAVVFVVPVVFSTGVLFFLNAFLLSSFLSRIPDVLVTLDTDKAALGLALFAAPVGSLCAAPFIGRVIDRRSPGRVAIASGVALSLADGLIGLAPTIVLLAAALFVAGLVNGCMEVAMNAAADRVEKTAGAKIMSRCHGFWSLGFMAGAVIAGAMAQAGIGVAPHLAMAGAAGVVGTLAIARIYPAIAFEPTVRRAGEAKAPVFALPNRLTIGICLMGVGVTLIEGAIYDWGSLYLRANIGAAPLPASVAFACFMLAMAIGRFSGDAIRERLEASAIIRVSAILCGFGLVGFVAAPNAIVAALALMVTGAGVCLVFPVAVTSVTTKGVNPSAAIASLALSIMAALLTGPPLIGILGEAFGLGFALLCTLPAAAVTFAFAGHARVAPTVIDPLPITSLRNDRNEAA